MKKSIITLFFVLFIGAISASAQTKYCFQNDGLKAKTTLSFTVSANKISDGVYEFSPYEDGGSPPIASFSGTKSGNILTIKFDGKVPDEFSKIKIIKWTLGKSLKVQFYGKNYQTNKFSVYSATFTKCNN